MRACFFDLETTGLNINTCEIVSIGAVCGKESFYIQIIPRCNIPYQATRVNGFRMSRRGNLLYNEKYCEDAVDPWTGLRAFVDFLVDLGDTLLLIGHNMQNFDSRVLGNQLLRYGIDISPLNGFIEGFADTMNVIRPFFMSKMSLKLNQALQVFCGRRQYEPHHALGDARATRDVARAVANRRRIGILQLMRNSGIVDAKDRLHNYYGNYFANGDGSDIRSLVDSFCDFHVGDIHRSPYYNPYEESDSDSDSDSDYY